ncbi:MAG: ATP-binding domain-containing protein [Deltaproteobacteria bacterium]|jgi:superfamily I DNA/RNA helicase|nr:ATP-binding domain-containing protein [Deltaproteobacteria bacterium]
MTWWIPENQLSENQNILINCCVLENNDYVWLRGFPGSGKTLLLLHIAIRLLSHNLKAKIGVITYTNSLADLLCSCPFFDDQPDNVIFNSHVSFYLNNRKHFDYIFIDEIQDIPIHHLAKIKTMGDKIYFAGDFDQTIYPQRCSISELRALFNPLAEYHLTEVFRLTPNVFALAKRVAGDNGVESEVALNPKNPNIKLIEVGDSEKYEEVVWIVENALKLAQPGQPSAILFQCHDDIFDFGLYLTTYFEQKYKIKSYGPILHFGSSEDAYRSFNDTCKRHGLFFRYLNYYSAKFAESEGIPLVYLSTIHNAKGLEFNNVFLPSLTQGAFVDSEKVKGWNLFLVAITRTRENLFITYPTHNYFDYIDQSPASICSKLWLKDLIHPPTVKKEEGPAEEEEDEGIVF